jgi:polyketide synthase 12/epothilone polyketide synthase D
MGPAQARLMPKPKFDPEHRMTQEFRASTNGHRQAEPDSIAIVGIGCRLPGGIDSPSQFWDFLCQGGDAISDVPSSRWDADALFAADPAAVGRTYARRGGFLSAIDQFDPGFFGISPREAAHIDPQQRLLLETAHEAMEDAGERWEDPALRSTGVFVGVFIHDYQHIQFGDRSLLGAHTGTGTAMSLAANRISYAFDLHGPSLAVDTACSSSLVAVDLACKAILGGDCDYALAGGVNVIIKPEMTIAMSKATMLSRDGRCKSFDSRADGYVRGEGAAVVVLRRLSHARAAGNPIYAVIRGSGVNSDGLTKGISVPNGDAQEALTRRVLKEAGVPASTVAYVEAHGTGTPVGDPIEANALGRVFSEGRSASDVPLLLGSVKTNIGHLESASGVAGLIKAALCLEHAEIPPNLHFQTPNPAIDFETLKLKVVQQKQAWPEANTPRRAAVNSFGFGGTNAHVILEQAPARSDGDRPSESIPARRLVLPMGAHDTGALRALAQGYARYLSAEGSNLQDFLYTVSQRRTHGAVRAAIVAGDARDLRERLIALGDGTTAAAATMGRRHEAFTSGRPVFVFSGMGPQWWAMGRELLEHEAVFRAAVERVDAKFRPLAGWSIIDRLLADESSLLIQETNVAQPALFAIQVGLSALWQEWGVEPGAIVGHSVGEAAALHAAGILTLDDAVTVIYHRSRLQHALAGSGGMLAAGISVSDAGDLLRGSEASISIAAINSPTSLTLSGDIAVLQRLRAQLEAQGRFARMLQVEVPYHSPRMDSIERELVQSLSELQPRAGDRPYYSTVDLHVGGRNPGDGNYWWRNVRQTVLFAAAIDKTIDDGHTCFLEVSPHPVLRTSIQECLSRRGVEGTVVSSLRRGQSDFDTMAASLGELHVAGAAIAWNRIIGPGRVVQLPTYAWQRSRHWAESDHAEQYRKGSSVSSGLRTTAHRHALLGGRLDLPTPTWLRTVRLAEAGYLSDHRIQGAVVFPGTGYLEMAMQTLADEDAAHGAEPRDGEYLLLSDVEIGRALYLAEGDNARLQTTRNGDRWAIHSSTEDGSWLHHASGKCRREAFHHAPGDLDLDSIKARCSNSLPADYAYRLFCDVGLQYGAAFQAIDELWYGVDESLARLEIPPTLTSAEGRAPSGFLFHPALLDACLHTLFGALNLNGQDADRRGNVFLPVSVRQFRVYRRPTSRLWSHARLHSRASQHFEADIRVYDENHALVAEVLDLRCQALEHPAAVAQKRQREWMLEYVWDETRAADPGTLAGRWLVLAPDDGHELIAMLVDRGADCVVVTPGADIDTQVSAAAGHLRGVIHAWSLGARDDEEPGAGWRHQEMGAISLMHLVQALAKRADELHRSPALWVLTHQTQAVGDSGAPVSSRTSTSSPASAQAINVAHSTMWGMRRVVANEHPYLSARIADTDGTRESLAAFVSELAGEPDEDELAFRQGTRFVHRLRRHVPETVVAVQPADATDSTRMELRVGRTGDLNSLAWARLPKLEIGEHEVEIEVHATALNFKDVMKATGLFPPRLVEGNLWSHETLGMECSGRVSRTGSKVAHVRPGDEVMALAPRSFASHAVTHGALVVSNPGLSAAEAAGVPVAFLTASAGLEHLAHLQPGERVLIHAGSGGVGQAAIQIALDIGAEVFATAGSEHKRQLVRGLGVTHVFDSRALRFAEEIRDATHGQGVDVVLNSLAGEAITQSLSVLSDYGRFVEIGKMDLDRDFPLGLRPFTRCLSFHAIDLDRMLAQRVDTCGRILRSIHDRLATGRLRALPVTVYEAAEIASAFRAMAAAAHTGKLVVDIAQAGVPIEDAASVTFRSDASYVITGGLGGFGLQLARWMAARGAGRLILVGRRGLQTPGAREAMASLRALGAEVQIEPCDVAIAEDVRRVVAAAPADRPVRGVFHAAAVLDDALIKNLDVERYRKTFGPKALGAWNLHEQTKDLGLDHFMCFSSMASVLGNQGSANYCAANAFVDALAHHRRRKGLAALTVNWGVIADVGMAADEDFYRQNLERNGLHTIHSSHCLEMLGLLMATNRVQTTVCPIDLGTWLRFNPAGREGRLKDLLTSASAAPEATGTRAAVQIALRERLDSVDAGERAQVALDTVRSIVAQVFRMDVGTIEPTRSLTALGADSLMAIEIRMRLEAAGLAMSVTQLLNRSSVATIAKTLLETLGYGAAVEAHTETAVRGTNPPEEADATGWLVRRAPRGDARVRLFCFPYAGGGPAVYHHWCDAVPDWVEVIAVSLPGRGRRIGERPLVSIAAAADAIVPQALPLLDRPFALFGHCMGAIVMYEVAQRLEQQHGKAAAHLFASGCMAPHLYNSPLVHEQEDGAFLDVLRLISFSGTRALIEDSDLRRTMFPVLRGDFRAVVEYGSSFKMRPALSAPITGLAAENDLFAAPKAMHAWGRYTKGGYDLVQAPGDHYFVESEREMVTGIVCGRLAQTLDGSSAPSLPHYPTLRWSRPHNDDLGLPPRRPRRRSIAANRRRPVGGATRVICFPGAGIRADELPLPKHEDTDPVVYTSVEWRGANARVSPRTIEAMVNHAYEAIRDDLDQPVIFYGHCLGAIVGYELARRLQNEGERTPDHLLVAGVVGPHLYVAPDAQKLPTEKLLELLSVLEHPFAERLKNDRAFLNGRIGALRADLEAMAGYQYQPGDPLDVPITAVSLRRDLWSYPLRTDAWRAHTRDRCEVVEWEGDHYFAMRHPARIHDLLKRCAVAASDAPVIEATAPRIDIDARPGR